jgi:hypothetical protein
MRKPRNVLNNLMNWHRFVICENVIKVKRKSRKLRGHYFYFNMTPLANVFYMRKIYYFVIPCAGRKKAMVD